MINKLFKSGVSVDKLFELEKENYINSKFGYIKDFLLDSGSIFDKESGYMQI